MESKYIFGSIAIGCLTILQGIAFITGHDGQIFAMTSAGITGLITFLLGLNISNPAQKKTIEELKTAILESYTKPNT